MKVFLTREPWELDYQVRIAQGGGGDRYWAFGAEGGHLFFQSLTEGAEPPVFCRMPVELVEAFARAAGQVTQASDATVEALADARDVRDRLLTLVEQGWNS